MAHDRPPPSPIRHVSQTVTLARLLDGERPELEAFPDEEPTRPQGIQFEVALLARYYREMASEDRVYVMRLAESYAARNAKT